MFFLSRFVHVFFFSILLFGLLPFQSLRAEVTLDGTLGGPQMTLEMIDSNFQIEHTYGKIEGTNLFHSFGTFNIETGQSATFSGPETINNIIGRVTGGALSNIDGLIKSDIQSANLYLLNPSGFLFGPNARLDVSGSFHVTTADYLSLGNEGIFYADPIKTNFLTIDPPTAFGFLRSNPGTIHVQESFLEMPEGEILSLIGGDIEIIGSGYYNRADIFAPGGRVDIASVLSVGEVIPIYTDETPDFLTDSFENFGTIKMYNGYIDAGGDGGGDVFIRGGRLIVDSSYIYASTKGDSDTIAGNGIDIKISGDMVVDNSDWTGSVIGTNIFGNVNQNSGGVRISADHLEIKNGAGIRSVAFMGSGGRSGDIELNTNNLLIQNSGAIQAGTGGSKKSGDILIKTGSLDIRDNGFIWTNAFGGTGGSGDIFVTTENVFLLNEKYPGYPTGITTRTYGSAIGNAGNITIDTKNLQMFPGTEISSPTWTMGQAGDIKVTIEEKGFMTGTNSVPTGVFANTFGTGKGADIEINAGHLEMTTHSSLQVQARSAGNAGDMTLNVDTLAIKDRAYISTSTVSTGNAGNVTLNVDTLEIKDGAYISASGLLGDGAASGDVDIVAKNILISGFESSTSPFNWDFTGISSTSGKNSLKSGDVNIQTANFEMTNRSTVTTVSKGPDEGGGIKIKANNIELLNGSAIIASAFGSGDGGLVEVEADKILVSGVHPELYTESTTGKEALAPSGIVSQAGLSDGNGGNLSIKADVLEVLDGGILATDTFGAGNAGHINIETRSLLISGENADMKEFYINSGADPKLSSSKITAGTNSTFLGDLATGDGGNITINTTELMMKEGGNINSETTTSGKGGNIYISASEVSLFSKAFISAKSSVSELADKAGNINISSKGNINIDGAFLLTSSERALGGNITVEADNITLINHTVVSAQSSGIGNAGEIYLGAQDTFFMDTSKVTTEALEASGGDIKVFAEDLIYLVDSEITSSVAGGTETTGGNINIDPEFVILKNSKIVAKAYEGEGGNIDIVADVFLSDPDSLIDASSSLGIDGQVDIQSPITHVSSIVAPLSKDFRSVVALLRKPCMARVHKGEYSSFMIKGRNNLPVEPGRFLSSPLSIP